MPTRSTTILIVAGLAGACTSAAPGKPPRDARAKATATAAQLLSMDGPRPEAIVISVHANGGERQYRGDPAEAAVAYVEVLNQGRRALDVDVLCVVSAQRDGTALDEAIATLTTRVAGLAVGEKRLAYLTLPVAATSALATGTTLPVACGTRPTGSAGPHVHTRTDWTAFSRYIPPDLGWRDDGPALDVFDCASRAAPVAGREVCVEAFPGPADGMYSDEAQAARFAVLCRLGGQAAWIETALAERTSPLVLRLAGIAAGRHELRCTTDADGAIAEGDERDNHATAPVTVLADAGDWRYGAAFRQVGRTARWIRGAHETARPPHYSLDVVVSNTGIHAWRGFRLECVGDGVRFEGGGQFSFPEHAMGPGDVTMHLGSRAPLPPPGPVTLTCTLQVTVPAAAGVAPATMTAVVDLPPP